jgi:SNF2 family DNA or RNA helicase
MAGYRLVINCKRLGKSSRYGVYFPFDTELIEKIKALPSEERKYVADVKLWNISVRGLLFLLKSYRGSPDVHFDFGTPDSRNIFIEQIKKVEESENEKQKQLHELNKKKEWWQEYKTKLEKDYNQFSEHVHSFLKPEVKLYPHQIVASMFIDQTRNALISHDMGLGKTLSAIAFVEMNIFDKVVVLTPNSLKFNFNNEVEKFTESKAYVINWKKNKYTVAESKYIIINYDFFNPKSNEKLVKKFNDLKIGQIDALVCDEVQKLKNIGSNTYKNFKKIFKDEIFKNGKVCKVFLSGTPAPNRAHELYSVLNQISKLDFPTKKFFQEYYCGMKYNPEVGGYEWTAEEMTTRFEELFHKISPYTHRRRKFEALPDLPDKIFQKIILELSDSDLITYNRLEAGVANDFIEHPSSNPLTIMLRLRQFTASLKVPYVIELIDEIMETGEKVIVVDYFKEALYGLKKQLGEAAALHTGDQTVEERSDIVNLFQDVNSTIKIFLGSIQTCNYGLTLTAASKLFIITLPYSVGELDQVSDRCILKGELVLSNEGYKPIENIAVNDFVYTHKGNWKKVINTKSRLERKKAF